MRVAVDRKLMGTSEYWHFSFISSFFFLSSFRRLKDDIYMVFELGEKGDLLSLLSEKGSLNEATTKFLMAEVATTVRYLFFNNLVAR